MSDSFCPNGQVLRTEALEVHYHLAVWDEPTLRAPSVVITSIQLFDTQRAAADFERFRAWCYGSAVSLVTCRVPHKNLEVAGFLESQQFRFIELNYRPELHNLQKNDCGAADDFVIEAASPEDEGPISVIASQIFVAGRFHDDPMIAAGVGNRRYRLWIQNAFQNPNQIVLKCCGNGELKGFFVIENLSVGHIFLSLVGLAPEFKGRGIGRRVWLSMLRELKRQGVDRVSTSISSLNPAILNLYVRLGFHFPEPQMTLHWCPLGPIRNRE